MFSILNLDNNDDHSTSRRYGESWKSDISSRTRQSQYDSTFTKQQISQKRDR